MARLGLRGFRRVTSVLACYDYSFEDGRDVHVIFLDEFENAIVPMGALKNIARGERRDGSG